MNIFSNKKILIYGLGKSGLSAFNFLKNKNNIFLYDDNKLNEKNFNFKKRLISYKTILNSQFDRIILSPGIDINACKLSKFLKKNDMDRHIIEYHKLLIDHFCDICQKFSTI